MILTSFYLMISLALLKEKENNINLNEEYNAVMGCLEEYEKMYLAQKKEAHEFRNDLTIIKCMIDKENVELKRYIDDLAQKREDYKFSDLEQVPLKKLRGVLYYKMIEMEKYEITHSIECIDVNWNKTNLISDRQRIKIYKMLNIFIDNAIDAVKELADKNISIIIYSKSNCIEIEINNNFEGAVSFPEINKEGFSTKGKGRGYGLTIARELIENEDMISNSTEIVGNVFVQKIKIRV